MEIVTVGSAVGAIFAAIAVIFAARRGFTRAADALHQTGDQVAGTAETVANAVNAFFAAWENGPGTDSAVVERLEAVERRVETIADDINRRYRKLAQERRRIEQLTDETTGEPDEAEQLREQLEADLAVREGRPKPNGRPRLRRI